MEQGSAVEAATRLHVAPTAISMQISQLEQEIGGSLFDRTFRPMRPTPLAEFLLPRARELIGIADRLLDDAIAVASGNAGTLTIGYTRSVIFSVLPKSVQALAEDLPDVNLELVSMLSEHQPNALLAGRIQLGIARHLDPPVPDPALSYVPLFDDPFCLAVPKSHPLAAVRRPAADDMRGVPIITYPKDDQSRFAEHVTGMLRRAGIQPRIVHQAIEIHTALGMVAAGLGSCVVPRSIAIGGREDIAFVHIDGIIGSRSTIYALTMKGTNGKAIQKLLDVMRGFGKNVGE